jgi:hypothetical protein
MKNPTLLLAAAALLLAGEAKADLVYDNGPINGTIDAYNVTTFAVSDSFVLSSGTTLAEAQIGLWEQGTATTVDWSIGTGAFGSDLGSGTSALDNTATGQLSGDSFPVFESTFSLTATLGPGTYWLTLNNALLGPAYWDENNGPSTAYVISTGNQIGSESFQLYSAPSPEPSSLILCGLGAIGLLVAAWRRKR